MAASRQQKGRKAKAGAQAPPPREERAKSPPIEPPQEAPPKAPKVPKGSLICVVCQTPYQRAKNLQKKAKVCTPFEFNHKPRFEPQPDGSTKRISCKCCRCLYKASLAKNRTLDGKLIPLARVPEFLEITKRDYPEVWLAFRVGLNAMLRVTELADLEVGDIVPDKKPLPIINVKALKKAVKMYFPVDIDPNLARELKEFVGNRVAGRVFEIPVRTLQHKFKQVVKQMGLDHLSIHALRHTGISAKARHCKTMDELNYLRVQARHESIETTKLYMGFEDHQRVEMAQRFQVF